MYDERIVAWSLLGGIDAQHGGRTRSICAKAVDRFRRKSHGDIPRPQLGGGCEEVGGVGARGREFNGPVFEKTTFVGGIVGVVGIGDENELT